jgi:hypothetical protein
LWVGVNLVQARDISRNFAFRDSIVAGFVFQSADLRINILALFLILRELRVPIFGP